MHCHPIACIHEPRAFRGCLLGLVQVIQEVTSSFIYLVLANTACVTLEDGLIFLLTLLHVSI
jgi:hypothetical protein